jgi:hypothetical protein
LKSIIALTIAAALLLTAGYLATTTVNEQLSQECVSPYDASYQNTWSDVYFVWQWWPNRDDDKGFVACIGPKTYLRYHPWDGAILALAGAGVAGYIGLSDKPKKGKKK